MERVQLLVIRSDSKVEFVLFNRGIEIDDRRKIDRFLNLLEDGEPDEGIPPGLDLVDEEDAIVHEVSLDDEIDAEARLDVFSVDLEFGEHEARYAELQIGRAHV